MSEQLLPGDINPYSLAKSLTDAKYFNRVPQQLTLLDLGEITAWQFSPIDPTCETHAFFEAWLDGHQYRIAVDQYLHDEIGRRFVSSLDEVDRQKKEWSFLTCLKRWLNRF